MISRRVFEHSANGMTTPGGAAYLNLAHPNADFISIRGLKVRLRGALSSQGELPVEANLGMVTELDWQRTREFDSHASSCSR